jgi:hypothetical protein
VNVITGTGMCDQKSNDLNKERKKENEEEQAEFACVMGMVW